MANTTAARKTAPAAQNVQDSQEGTEVQEDPKVAEPTTAAPHSPLSVLRDPFSPEAIGKLPKGTCARCREIAKTYRACENHTWVRQCQDCGGQHSSAAIHLDYVGHADVTDRLLSADSKWTWTPFSLEQMQALPPAMREAGLWINLTVAGVTRPGFGDAAGKTGPNAVKEAIGDALRNAAMRFGVALDLWAKGDRAWDLAPDATPESALPSAEQPASARPSIHTRHQDVEATPGNALSPQDHPLWEAHMRALSKDLEALSPADLAEVQHTWPGDVPTPPTGAMSIQQIGEARTWLTHRGVASNPQPTQERPGF